MGNRIERALQVRDKVLALMRSNSRWEVVGSLRLQMWQRDRFRAALSTPFNPFRHDQAKATSYDEAIVLERAPRPQPYELSLWAGRKVLAIEWGRGDPRIISFQPGAWEAELLALANDPGTQP